jgi:predicted MFS family arabinose efflux permease
MTLPQVSSRRADRGLGIHSLVTFRALRHPNYRLWFFGQGLSLIGTWAQTMAQQVLVYRLTGSATALGVTSFMSLLPLVPLSIWGGSLSDRLPKRTVILATQTAMLFQAFVLAVLTWTGMIQVWHIYVMAFLLGAAEAVDTPARQSFIVDMVEGREDLTNAIGLNSAIFNGGRTIGPALGGIAVATLGEATAFFLNGLSFIAVILSLLRMRNLPPFTPPVRSRLLDHTTQGIRFVLTHETLLALVSLVGASAFLSVPYLTLLPVFAHDVLKGPAGPMIAFVCGGDRPLFRCQAPEALTLGILLAAMGAGALIGSLLAASLPESAPRGRLLVLGNLVFASGLLFFANSHEMILSTLLMILVGMSFVLQNAMANTLLQISAPDELRGRVMGVYSLVNHGGRQVGGLQAGFVADWLGAPFSVAVGAAVSLLYGFWVAIRFPEVRRLR